MVYLPKTDRFFCLVITLLILLIYSNSFQNAFQFDDYHVIEKNPYIKHSENYIKFFGSPEMGSGLLNQTSAYRPLFLLSFALNYSLGGLDVFGYHLFNLLTHTLCAILVYFITLLFLQTAADPRKGTVAENQMIALFAALIFAVHPIQTESVTYITGRSSSLTALFFLGSFLLYMRYGMGGKIHQLVLSSILYGAALLVKETAITLPVLLFLYNLFFPLQRSWKRRLFSIAPYLALSFAYLAVRMYFLGTLHYSAKPIRTLDVQLLTQVGAWVHCLKTLLIPINLNVDYDFPIAQSFWEYRVLFSAFLLVGLGAAAWKFSKASRPVGFFTLWFAFNLLPTNGVVPLEDVVTDRWVYLPSVAFAVIAALVARWVFQAKVKTSNRAGKVAFFFLCALVVELYGYGTLLRNIDWTSEWTFWEDAAIKSPNKARPHIGLGLALKNAGKMEEAIKEFKKAIQLNPKDGRAYLNLGIVHYGQGRLEEAIQAYEKTLEVSPRLASETHNNLALVYLRQGRNEDGVREFQRAIEARPINAHPYYNLGNYYEKKGDIDRAISCMEQATNLEPEFFPAYAALSGLYGKKGWKEKSQEAYKKYLQYGIPAKYYAG